MLLSDWSAEFCRRFPIGCNSLLPDNSELMSNHFKGMSKNILIKSEVRTHRFAEKNSGKYAYF
jgi:hypothetical protein